MLSSYKGQTITTFYLTATALTPVYFTPPNSPPQVEMRMTTAWWFEALIRGELKLLTMVPHVPLQTIGVPAKYSSPIPDKRRQVDKEFLDPNRNMGNDPGTSSNAQYHGGNNETTCTNVQAAANAAGVAGGVLDNLIDKASSGVAANPGSKWWSLETL